MASQTVKKGSSNRSKGDMVSGSNTDKEVDGQNRPKRWVKAIWKENKQSQCDTIPKSWVSRSLWTVSWPPPSCNYKKAIEMCLAPGSVGWSTFQLKWCSNTVDSLAEAQGIQTAAETTDTDGSSSCEEDEQLSAAINEDSQQASRGRGLRY
jgi:hypothetical protein